MTAEEKKTQKKINDEAARERMIQFIKTHYAKTLGEDIEILKQPGGLEILQQKYCSRDAEKVRSSPPRQYWRGFFC